MKKIRGKLKDMKYKTFARLSCHLMSLMVTNMTVSSFAFPLNVMKGLMSVSSIFYRTVNLGLNLVTFGNNLSPGKMVDGVEHPEHHEVQSHNGTAHSDVL